MHRLFVGLLTLLVSVATATIAPAQQIAQVQPPNETPIPGGYNPCYNPRPPANCGLQIRPTPYAAGPNLGPGTLHDNSGRGYFELGSQDYRNGDVRDAFRAYMRSAHLGYPRGEAAVGNMLLDGEGVARDVPAAASWLKRAADQGHYRAAYTMGGLYEDGLGVRRDYAQAMHYYLLSAAQGYGRASFVVGISYAVGDIVPRNRSVAISWLRRSVNEGFGFASTIANLIATSGTPNFTSVDELANYLQAQQARAYSASQQNSGCGDPVACVRAGQELEAWHRRVDNENVPHNESYDNRV